MLRLLAPFLFFFFFFFFGQLQWGRGAEGDSIRTLHKGEKQDNVSSLLKYNSQKRRPLSLVDHNHHHASNMADKRKESFIGDITHVLQPRTAQHPPPVGIEGISRGGWCGL
jgi:hypothetical protein